MYKSVLKSRYIEKISFFIAKIGKLREIYKKKSKKVRIFGRYYYLLYLCTRIYAKCDFFPAARQKANDERGLNYDFGQYLSNMLGVKLPSQHDKPVFHPG